MRARENRPQLPSTWKWKGKGGNGPQLPGVCQDQALGIYNLSLGPRDSIHYKMKQENGKRGNENTKCYNLGHLALLFLLFFHLSFSFLD